MTLENSGVIDLITSPAPDALALLPAVLDGQVQRATAFDSTDSLSRALVPEELRFYRNVATANIVFPVKPDPSVAPAITISTSRDVNGVRQRTDGLLVAGSAVLIGVTARAGETELPVTNVTVRG
jgi:hypothetical protein